MPTKKRNSVEPKPFQIGSIEVEPGRRGATEIPVSRFVTGEWLNLNVEVVHGAQPGPTIWLSGAIHGDELDGVEIIRRVLNDLRPSLLAGTVVAVPVVNVFGFVSESRYLPDRRDLNRSFPGKNDGSMASLLAHLFMTEVVGRADYGLDFHCGSDNRINLPQLRCDLDHPQTRTLAQAFAPDLILHSKSPDKSLRRAATDRGVPTLVYEGGEAGRFTRSAIQMGVEGTLRFMRALGMVSDAPEATHDAVEARTSGWVRAPRSGICTIDVELGQRVRKREMMGSVTELMGRDAQPFRAAEKGVVIGHRVHPLVHKGEALVHVAR